MPVIPPKHRVVLRDVSPLLKAELIHPDRGRPVAGIRFSPDGRRIIASSYPEGVIQLWDVENGRQLVKIDTGRAPRILDECFVVSPDWKTAYSWWTTGSRRRGEAEGKKLNYWDFEGDTREWDLDTGALKRVFRQSPVRAVGWFSLSPDARTLLFGSELPGEGRLRRATCLLDLETGKFRDLPGHLSLSGTISPDGRFVEVCELDDDLYTVAIAMFDIKSGKLIRRIPLPDQFAETGQQVFSPDGKLLAIAYFLHTQRGDAQHSSGSLRFFDMRSGSPIAAFPYEAKDGGGYDGLAFSPDGRIVAAVNSQRTRSQLFLFDVARRSLAHTIQLGEEGAMTESPVFSPDGRWIAIATQVIPEELQRDRNRRAEDVEQPRIHLVEVATGKVRETLVAPQCFPGKGCFSPDSKTLATGGLGRVLLWDLNSILGE
jgi:WD40 repeat protein